MTPAITVRNLGKSYRIVHQTGKAYRTLRDDIADHAKRILTGQWKSQETGEEFWALRDINFDIQPGEIVGVIGRNGAGKSTLLKTLCRITPPTTGEIIMRGRVGSLLEVGTGFHPELTGRENVYLSGAILGMKRAEVVRKFDEIVAFAEVEQFLDTPVKRYSSGMYVRLAFAVAAHLETEILLVDEVLAVGDVKFQEKCMKMMSSISETGRTIFFVSHNMTAVAKLCKRGLLLHGGKLVSDANVEKSLQAYKDLSTDRSLSDVRFGRGSRRLILPSPAF
jgi:lipopolysaccharide transport system ATP-binding protein